MNVNAITLPQQDARKLLGAANADAALLYLYIAAGNDPGKAGEDLRLPDSRLNCAGAILRQLGLWPEVLPTKILAGERPNYSENDVLDAMERDMDFRSLYGEVQRLLGRNLNTEELKILLGFYKGKTLRCVRGFLRYLGLPGDVISLLVCYCKERARKRGSLRNPSLRTIEKEAYQWAEQGIDTLEAASAYIQTQNQRESQMTSLMSLLQIRGRNLTAAEERYAGAWLTMGFDADAIREAYERTCLNTGGLNWAYMNKILTRWQQAGFHTLEQVRAGDQKNLPKGASGQLGAAELEAIQNILQEG